MDGMRFNAIVRDGKVEFRSRNGKELNLLGNLEEEFAKLAGSVDCVFDGELLVIADGKIVDRQTGNGILSKANKGTISAKEAALVNATVWDMIPFVYFSDGHCPVPYSTRFAKLQEFDLPEKIHLVEHIVVDTLDAANTIFEEYLSKGQEGIILKDPKGVWEDKRAKHQIKFKGELECSLGGLYLRFLILLLLFAVRVSSCRARAPAARATSFSVPSEAVRCSMSVAMPSRRGLVTAPYWRSSACPATAAMRFSSWVMRAWDSSPSRSSLRNSPADSTAWDTTSVVPTVPRDLDRAMEAAAVLASSQWPRPWRMLAVLVAVFMRSPCS
jgi:hypothetical protein